MIFLFEIVEVHKFMKTKPKSNKLNLNINFIKLRFITLKNSKLKTVKKDKLSLIKTKNQFPIFEVPKTPNPPNSDISFMNSNPNLRSSAPTSENDPKTF